MIKPRAKLLPSNPSAIVQTSKGWLYPDGTVKPFYQPKPAGVPSRDGLLSYLAARVFTKQQN
jgi:hypothetical protein